MDKLTFAEREAKRIENSRIIYILQTTDTAQKELVEQWREGVISKSELKARFLKISEHIQINL